MRTLAHPVTAPHPITDPDTLAVALRAAATATGPDLAGHIDAAARHLDDPQATHDALMSLAVPLARAARTLQALVDRTALFSMPGSLGDDIEAARDCADDAFDALRAAVLAHLPTTPAPDRCATRHELWRARAYIGPARAAWSAINPGAVQLVLIDTVADLAQHDAYLGVLSDLAECSPRRPDATGAFCTAASTARDAYRMTEAAVYTTLGDTGTGPAPVDTAAVDRVIGYVHAVRSAPAGFCGDLVCVACTEHGAPF